MTDEQRQEIMRRYNEGMCAMSDAQMAVRAAEQAEGMRQRGPLTSGEQEAMRNFWGGTADEQNNFAPNPPPETLWKRFKRWMRA
jgi:hypothetical protein